MFAAWDATCIGSVFSPDMSDEGSFEEGGVTSVIARFEAIAGHAGPLAKSCPLLEANGTNVRLQHADVRAGRVAPFEVDTPPTSSSSSSQPPAHHGFWGVIRGGVRFLTLGRSLRSARQTEAPNEEEDEEEETCVEEEYDDEDIEAIEERHAYRSKFKSLGTLIHVTQAFRRARTIKSLPRLPPAEAAKMPGLQLHSTVPPHKWCITRNDLDEFEHRVRVAWMAGKIPDNPKFPNPHHNNPRVGPNIHQVNKHFIRPVTKRAGSMAYSLMLHPEGLECDVFATHCWAEGCFEFCEKVRRSWPKHHKNLWCCFLANPQNGDISELLKGDVLDSPFAQAIRAARTMLVIPNKAISIYTRLWCVLEAKIAIENSLDVKLPKKAPTWKLWFALLPAIFTGLTTFILAVIMFEIHLADKFFGQVSMTIHWQIWLSFVIMVLLAGVRFCFKLPASTRSCIDMVLFSFPSAILIWHSWHATEHLQVHYLQRPEYIIQQGLAIDFWLIGWTWIRRRVMRKIIQKEAQRLEFTSVRDANCSNDGDRDRLREAVRGEEDIIDSMIHVLVQAGKWNQRVKQDLAMGFHPARGRSTDWPKACAVCLGYSFIFLYAFRIGNESDSLLSIPAAGGVLRLGWALRPWMSVVGIMSFPALVGLLTMLRSPGKRRMVFVMQVFWRGLLVEGVLFLGLSVNWSNMVSNPSESLLVMFDFSFLGSMFSLATFAVCGPRPRKFLRKRFWTVVWTFFTHVLLLIALLAILLLLQWELRECQQHACDMRAVLNMTLDNAKGCEEHIRCVQPHMGAFLARLAMGTGFFCVFWILIMRFSGQSPSDLGRELRRSLNMQDGTFFRVSQGQLLQQARENVNQMESDAGSLLDLFFLSDRRT